MIFFCSSAKWIGTTGSEHILKYNIWLLCARTIDFDGMRHAGALKSENSFEDRMGVYSFPEWKRTSHIRKCVTKRVHKKSAELSALFAPPEGLEPSTP